ncbi:MAG: GxxExxY protein [Patescibacteria group bacterium]|nr:GxxExxY protein [Patescibacteria group bacterium]
MDTDNFLEKDLSYEIVGCFFDVRNKYGSAHNERVYHRTLAEQFDIKKIKYISEPKIEVFSLDTGRVIAQYVPDFLVEDKIVIELKAKDFNSSKSYRQTLEYLKASKYEIAYLVNFGEENFKPVRLIYTNNRKNFISLIK